MKRLILYVLMSIIVLSCKNGETESATTKPTENNIEVTDTVNKQTKQDKSLKEKVIGQVYSNIKEIEEFRDYYCPGGGSAGESIGGKGYVIEGIHIKEGRPSYLIFSQTIILDADVIYKILDILDLREEKLLNNKNNMLYYGGFCYKDGRPDDEIIAIAEYDEDKEFLTKVFKAWHADRKTGRIIEIPTGGIKVDNIDYGLE